jgi:hypothetical protein
MELKQENNGKELEDLRSENRKLVLQISDIFHMLRDEALIEEGELSDLLNILNKYDVDLESLIHHTKK